MASSGTPPGWYPDPEQPGAQRYFDGARWTDQRSWGAPPPYLPAAPPGYGPSPGYGPPPSYGPPPGYGAPPGYGYGPPPWKGAALGRPAGGPGSLATPGQRLGAKLLDALMLLGVNLVLAGVIIALIAGLGHSTFQAANNSPNASSAAAGLVFLGIFVWFFVILALSVCYDAVFTIRYGRSLGKRWLHIRPIRTDGTLLSTGQAFGRAALYAASGIVSFIGLLDPLWCCWDENVQCVHDKIVGAIVVHD